MEDPLDLTGRRALVTGGCRGIGAAIALAFAEHGAEVLVHARGDAESQKWAQSNGFGYFRADFAHREDVHRLAEEVLAGGGLDILVNNAGMEINATVEHLDPDAVSRQLRVNLEAPILLTHLTVPALKRSGHGSVINVTSIHGQVPAYANSVYCAAKAGLELFTRTAAIELGPSAVRVNALAPGAIETQMNRKILDEVGRDRFAEWIPLGHVGEVTDIAGPAVFLASDASGYMSGATIVVDGAYSHHLVRYRTSNVD